jgi:hypothetical protein
MATIRKGAKQFTRWFRSFREANKPPYRAGTSTAVTSPDAADEMDKLSLSSAPTKKSGPLYSPGIRLRRSSRMSPAMLVGTASRD